MKKRKLAALSAATVLCLGAMPVPAGSAVDDVLKFEFEDGTLVDCEEREPIKWEKVDEDEVGCMTSETY